MKFLKDLGTFLLLFLAFAMSQITMLSLTAFGSKLLLHPWVFMLICVVLTATSYYLIWKNHLKENDKTKQQLPKILKTLPVLFILYFIFLLTASALLIYFDIKTEPQSNQERLNELFLNNTLFMTLITVIIMPILEELIFRWYIPYAFDIRFKWNKYNWIGYLIGWLFFVAAHHPNGITGLISYGGLATIITLMRIKFDNVNAGILTHSAWNGLIVLTMIF